MARRRCAVCSRRLKLPILIRNRLHPARNCASRVTAETKRAVLSEMLALLSGRQGGGETPGGRAPGLAAPPPRTEEDLLKQVSDLFEKNVDVANLNWDAAGLNFDTPPPKPPDEDEDPPRPGSRI